MERGGGGGGGGRGELGEEVHSPRNDAILFQLIFPGQLGRFTGTWFHFINHLFTVTWNGMVAL